MPNLTPEQEQFLKDFSKAMDKQLNQEGANWLRGELKSGAMKYSELTPEQIEILDEYPEDKKQDQ